jgi:hypothetical protein
MTKLLESPLMSLDLVKELYTPDMDVIVYKQGKTLNYSFPELQDALNGMTEIMYMAKEYDLDIRCTLRSAQLNHIVTVKQNWRP